MFGFHFIGKKIPFVLSGHYHLTFILQLKGTSSILFLFSPPLRCFTIILCLFISLKAIFMTVSFFFFKTIAVVGLSSIYEVFL